MLEGRDWLTFIVKSSICKVGELSICLLEARLSNKALRHLSIHQVLVKFFHALKLALELVDAAGLVLERLLLTGTVMEWLFVMLHLILWFSK